MGALVGFICGYYLGVKTGPDGLEEMRNAMEEIAKSRELQALLGSLQNAMQGAVTGSAAKAAGGATGSGPDLGKIAEAMGTITQSTEFQAFVGSGAAMLGRIMEQGRRPNGS